LMIGRGLGTRILLTVGLLCWLVGAVLPATGAASAGPAGGGSFPGEDTVLTPTGLTSDPGRYHGKPVTLKGEVIGSVMRRGDHVWLNVGDGVSAVGVWAPAQLGEAIRFTGGYASRGDTVVVTGLFSAACPLHGGDSDLHALAWRVVERGYRKEYPIPTWRWGLALSLAAGGALLTLVAWRASRI